MRVLTTVSLLTVATVLVTLKLSLLMHAALMWLIGRGAL